MNDLLLRLDLAALETAFYLSNELNGRYLSDIYRCHFYLVWVQKGYGGVATQQQQQLQQRITLRTAPAPRCNLPLLG